MAVTIPRLNSQIKASTTPATQTAVQSDIKYRDIGLDDAVVGAMKDLGGAAIIAKENKETGMANATVNEFNRRVKKWYADAVNGKSYKGYDAENIMGDMRKFAYQTIEDLRLNGFVKADGSTVPALSEQVHNEKFLPSVDSMLINMDSSAIEYSSREIAVAEENDFNANLDRVSLTIAGSDDPVVQASASNELNGLFKVYYGGRMSDEARGVAVAKIMKTSLETRAKNLSTTDPAKALYEFSANKNYAVYGCDLTNARASAIENMAVIAGTNEALITNGMSSTGQNWSDQPLGEGSDPVLRNRFPYSAAGLMSPQEYATYAMKKAETWNSKSASITNEVRRSEVEKNTTLLSDLGKIDNQDDYNNMVEEIAERGDAYSLSTLSAVKLIQDRQLAYDNQEKMYSEYANPDGSFNELKAINSAYESIDKFNPGLSPASEEYNTLVNNYVSLQRRDFEKRKDFLSQQSGFAITSADALDKVYSLIYDDSQGQSIETVQDLMPYLEGMTPADAQAASEALITKAQTKKQAMDLAKAEGGTFDVYKVASDQWTALGHSFKFEDGELKEGDAEARERFISRFVELYIRKHSSEKPNQQELENLTIEAYNTYIKAPRYDEISRFTNTLRRMAAESYDRPEVNSFDVRSRVRDFFETGGISYSEEDLKKKIGDLQILPSASRYLQEMVTKGMVKDVEFDDEVYSDFWDSLVEIYEESEYTEKEKLIDFISRGDNSALLRILKAKGKF